jgi:hypothetical protein
MTENIRVPGPTGRRQAQQDVAAVRRRGRLDAAVGVVAVAQRGAVEALVDAVGGAQLAIGS